MAQLAKCKVCCLWRNVFHFDGSMREYTYCGRKRFFGLCNPQDIAITSINIAQLASQCLIGSKGNKQ